MLCDAGSVRILLKRLAIVCVCAALFSAGCGRKPRGAAENGEQQAIAPDTGSRSVLATETGSAGTGQYISSGSGLLPGQDQAARAPMTPAVRREFERKYEKGIEFLEKQEYGEATRIFEQLLHESSDPQDASVAEYCLAEICFRNKANTRALELFKSIVEKYPGTPAADNAKAGIEYLENFHKHEADYVSPEVEDRKRRGSGR